MKKSLIALILASMAVGALVGCKSNANNNSDKTSSTPTSESQPGSESQPSSEEEMPAEYDLMKYWAGNPAEEYYDVEESGTNTVITYTDLTGEENGGWAYVSRSFAYDAGKIARFTEYKKFSFTAKLEKTTGSDIVLVKAEGTGQVFEKRIQLSTTEQTFEFSTAFISDWSAMSALLFFANRNIKEAGNGTLTLTRFVLSKEEVNPDYDISGSMPTVPQDWNYYDGEEKLDVMYSWGYNAQGEIATEQVAGGFKFTWGGEVGKSEAWSYVSAKIKNAGEEHLMKDSDFKRVVFTVQGTAGQQAILKFEARVAPTQVKAGKEVTIDLTGEEQVVELDVSSVIPNAEADSWFPLIMPAPGQTGVVAAGELLLKGCYLDKTAVVVPEEKNDPTFAEIWMDKVAVTDPCYTIYHDGHVMTVDYAKNATGWESMLLKVSDSEEWFVGNGEYTKIAVRLKATVKVSVLLKPYDNNANERWVHLEANEPQDIIYTVAADTADLTKSFVIFICVGDEAGQATSGRVFFEGLRLCRPNTNVGFDGDVKLNGVQGYNNQYTLSLDEGDLVADYAFSAVDFHMLEMYASAEDIGAYNKLTGTITSTAKTTLLVKPMDATANETLIELEADVPYELDYLFTAVKLDAAWPKIIMSVSGTEGDALTGSIKFAGLTLSIYDTEMVSKDPNPINLAGGYIDNWSFASDCYYLRKIPNGTKVIVENGKAGGWENMQAGLVLTEGWFNQADYTRVTAELTASVDMEVILKPYDNGACERSFVLHADETTYVDYTFTIENPDTFDFSKSFIFFVGTTGCAAGAELLIEKLALTNPKANIEKDGKLYLAQEFFAHADNFAITAHDDGKGMTLGYTKQDGMEWEGIQIYATAHDLSELKTLHLKGTSEKAVHLKFKLDGPGEEKEVILAAGEFDEAIGFTNTIDAKWNKVLVFVAYDAEDAKTGSVNFSELYFG